ncbi:putative sporulation protein YtxC [Bacillus sp. EB600]|uniref:putative sporulation protein YtxC n=1 Tax=Bacillus sp. EB600 TaxID=2806345 RepID=UPI00210DCCE6|nr:putative sporulation protein YtxC [Bacillus sp. EB600]MCQ6278333.1 putative sporulation protein YtxC [Bacillus sp. EB600]
MAEIVFQSKDDAEKFYHHLLKYLKLSNNHEEILLIEDRHILKIIDDKLTSACLKHVRKAFYEFVIDVKRDDWLKRILAENYYFQDPEEQRHIMEIVYSILEGERKDLEIFLEKTNEKQRIKEAIEQVFQENISLSFDSFIKFRLRPYFLDLESYVKISIDEYKMEQEYQIFVQTLREFLHDRTPKMEALHLLLGEEIIFYNESLEEIKRGELIKMIDRKLLFNHPVYVDSASIAPLLSIAPTTIFLYTKNPEEALVRTISNIFEERVSIMPFHTFCDQIQWVKWEKNTKKSENGA